MTLRTFNVRKFDLKRDYAMACQWWRGHGVNEVPPGYLPACGLVQEMDGAPAAVAWVYLDNSTPLAWLAYTTTRPGLSPRAALDALSSLLGAALASAESQKRRVMITGAPTPSMERFFAARGFISNHEAVTMFKEVG